MRESPQSCDLRESRVISSPQGWPPASSPLDPWLPSPFPPPAPRTQTTNTAHRLSGSWLLWSSKQRGAAMQISVTCAVVRARGRRPSLRPICDNPPQYVLHQFSLCAALSKDNHLAHRDAQSTPCSVYCSPTFIKQINCFALVHVISGHRTMKFYHHLLIRKKNSTTDNCL